MTISSISARRRSPISRRSPRRPAAALGSTRDKPDRKYCQEIFKVLKAHAIDTFFYIGGNDSSDTVRIVAEEAKKSDHGLRAVHIPKTIDNDLVGFDHTPGYPSAARFVAQAFAGANLDNLALKGVYVRGGDGPARRLPHRGFGAGAQISRRRPPSHLSARAHLRRRQVPRRREGRSSSVTAAASSPSPRASTTTRARRSSPSSWAKAEKDAHGNVQLSGTGALADLLCEEVKSKLGIKRVRGDTFGYLQRSFVGCVSKVDQREAREVGEKAVQYAMAGAGDGSVAIRRVADYAVDYPLIPLETVAGKTRVMEDHLINAAGNDVTPAFVDYLRPLLGADMIEVARLRGAKVEKASVLMGDST